MDAVLSYLGTVGLTGEKTERKKRIVEADGALGDYMQDRHAD